MPRINQQVERILDEGTGARRSVIVQMQSDEGLNEGLIRIAAEVHRRRNLSLSARDLLPVHHTALEQVRKSAGGKLTTSARSALGRAEASLSLQVGRAMVPAARAMLKSSGQRALAPLSQSDVVKRSVEEAGKRSRKSSPETSPGLTSFWSSRSVVLDLKKRRSCEAS